MSTTRLLDHFSALDDPRQSWKVTYPLPEVLLIVLCATMAGAEDFVQIELWANRKFDFLRRFLHGMGRRAARRRCRPDAPENREWTGKHGRRQTYESQPHPKHQRQGKHTGPKKSTRLGRPISRKRHHRNMNRVFKRLPCTAPLLELSTPEDPEYNGNHGRAGVPQTH